MAYAAQERLPFFVVMNAGSGSGDAQQAIDTVRKKLAADGRRHEVYLVEKPEQLSALAMQAAHAAQTHNGAVIGAGGDGTLSAVAQQAYAAGRPFGVLPQGTFNYFGRTHGIPEDTAAALDVLLQAIPRRIQIGLINEHVFLVNASLGLYPRLLQEREAFKQQFGRNRIVALIASAVTFLRDHRALSLQIELDGNLKTLYTSTLFVGNNALQLEQVGIDAADEVPGQLAAISVRPGNKLNMLSLLLRGALGNLGESEHIDSFTFTQLTVRSRLSRGRKRFKVAMDGEIFWFDTPLIFSIAPRPFHLLLPR